MNNNINSFFLGGSQRNSNPQNLGFFLLRFFVGLAFCTVFEKFFPQNGVWGPPDWFIQDVADMGFPFPSFFAWAAVLSEFFGGIMLMLGLFTRPAALLNVIVTCTATFMYHEGDIGDSGLLSFFFMLMSFCILLFGPGKFSLDYIIRNRANKRLGTLSAGIFLLFLFSFGEAAAQAPSRLNQNVKSSADIEKVQFYLKNNRVWPRRVTFIIYQPQQEGNNTIVKWFLPFQKAKFDLPPKSKIYLATDSQVDTVMQGKRIDQDKPFIIVDENLNNTTLKLSRGN